MVILLLGIVAAAAAVKITDAAEEEPVDDSKDQLPARVPSGRDLSGSGKGPEKISIPQSRVSKVRESRSRNSSRDRDLSYLTKN